MPDDDDANKRGVVAMTRVLGTGETVEVAGDLLVAADGCTSSIRRYFLPDVLRMARRVRFHRKGKLRDRHRHPKSVPGARQLPLLRSCLQDPRCALRVAWEQAQLALVHQRSRARAHGELGDDEGERGDAGTDAGGGGARVGAGAGAADRGDRGAVRERDLRRGPGAPAVVGGRPRGAGGRRGAPDHPARAAEHQHVLARRARARGVSREAGGVVAAARAGRLRGGADAGLGGAGAARTQARAAQAGPAGGRW